MDWMFFTDQEMTEAEKLRELGLTWRLQSGLYIWDIQGKINAAETSLEALMKEVPNQDRDAPTMMTAHL